VTITDLCYYWTVGQGEAGVNTTLFFVGLDNITIGQSEEFVINSDVSTSAAAIQLMNSILCSFGLVLFFTIVV
jgi:hypothetical protein